MKHPLRWISLLAACGIIFVACSNGTTSKSTNPSATPKGAPAGGLYPLSELNKAEHVGTPKRGGTIQFGLESALLNFSPNTSVIQPADLAIESSVFDALVTYNAKGGTVGQLASSIVGSNSFKTWTVKLRPGIKFSNGVALDAGQVESHTKWLQASPACNCASDASNIENFTMPDGPTGMTFVYTLKDANVAWPTKLASALGWITESGARNAAPNPASPDIQHLIGTGPFMWNSSDVYTVVKNPNYYGTDTQNHNAKLPYLDKIIFRPLADATTRLQAVQSNSVQIMQTADTSNIVGAKADPNLVVQPITGSSSTLVVTNLTKPPFGVTPANGQTDAQAAVAALSNSKATDARTAFAMAINRNEINQKVYDGSRVPAYGFIPPTSPYFDPTGLLPRYNPTKAKALITKLKGEGEQPEIKAICIPTPASMKIFTIVEEQTNAVGFKSSLKSIDQAVLVSTLLLGKSTTATADWNVACFRAPQQADPDGLYNSLETHGATNLVRYSNPKVDAALNKGRTVSGVAARKPYYDIVQQQVAKDKAQFPLLFDYYGNIHRKNVSGLGIPSGSWLGTISLAGLYYTSK